MSDIPTTTTPPGYDGCRVTYVEDGNFRIYLRPNSKGETKCIHVPWHAAEHPANEQDRLISNVIKKNYTLPWPKNPKEPKVTTTQLTPQELNRAVAQHATKILSQFDRPISTTYFEMELAKALGTNDRIHCRSALHRLCDRGKIRRHGYDTKKGYFWSNFLPPETPPASMKFRRTNASTGQQEDVEEDDEDDSDSEPESTFREEEPKSKQAPSVDPQLERRVKKLENQVEGIDTAHGMIDDRVRILESRIEELNKVRKVEFTVVQPDKTKVTLKEDTHEAFEQVLWHLTVGDNVMLVGPKGCGKTTLCEQLAKALKRDWNFLSMSGGTTETKLYGKSTPNITNGKLEYHRPEFVRLYEEGGLFLIDEVDAGDPNVLLSLNNPLENKWMCVERAKNPKIKMHTKFICISAANTWGHGADRQYVSRNQLDSAFVERWVQIDMDYDKNLELKLCEKLCPGKTAWVELLHRYRAAVRLNRLEREISTRWIVRTLRWLKAGKDESYCEEMMFKGWRESEIRQVKAGA